MLASNFKEFHGSLNVRQVHWAAMMASIAVYPVNNIICKGSALCCVVFIVIMSNEDNICSNMPVHCWRSIMLQGRAAWNWWLRPQKAPQKLCKKKCKEKFHTKSHHFRKLPSVWVHAEVRHHSVASVSFQPLHRIKFLWINSFWKQSTLVICSFLALSAASSNVIVELASILMCTQDGRVD